MLNTVVSYVFLAWDTVPLRCSLSNTWRESIETFLFIDIVFSISILVLCSVSLYWYCVLYLYIGIVFYSISLYWFCCVLYLYIGIVFSISILVLLCSISLYWCFLYPFTLAEETSWGFDCKMSCCV